MFGSLILTNQIYVDVLIKKNDRLTPTYLIVFASEPGQLEGLVWWVCFCATWGPTRLGSEPTRDEDLVKPTNWRSRRAHYKTPYKLHRMHKVSTNLRATRGRFSTGGGVSIHVLRIATRARSSK